MSINLMAFLSRVILIKKLILDKLLTMGYKKEDILHFFD